MIIEVHVNKDKYWKIGGGSSTNTRRNYFLGSTIILYKCHSFWGIVIMFAFCENY